MLCHESLNGVEESDHISILEVLNLSDKEFFLLQNGSQLLHEFFFLVELRAVHVCERSKQRSSASRSDCLPPATRTQRYCEDSLRSIIYAFSWSYFMESVMSASCVGVGWRTNVVMIVFPVTGWHWECLSTTAIVEVWLLRTEEETLLVLKGGDCGAAWRQLRL